MHTLNLAQLGEKRGPPVRSSPCPPNPSTLQRAPLGPVDGWKKLTARMGEKNAVQVRGLTWPLE